MSGNDCNLYNALECHVHNLHPHTKWFPNISRIWLKQTNLNRLCYRIVQVGLLVPCEGSLILGDDLTEPTWERHFWKIPRAFPWHSDLILAKIWTNIMDMLVHNSDEPLVDSSAAWGYDVSGDEAGHGCPHKPGTCLVNEEFSLGKCYRRCDELTDGQYPYRTSETLRSPWNECRKRLFGAFIPLGLWMPPTNRSCGACLLP